MARREHVTGKERKDKKIRRVVRDQLDRVYGCIGKCVWPSVCRGVCERMSEWKRTKQKVEQCYIKKYKYE